MTVHFPVALLSVSVLWDGLAFWTGTATWWTMGYWTLVLGLASSLPAIATGFIEFVSLPSDSPAGNVAIWHLMLTGTAVTSFLGSLLIRVGPEVPGGGRAAGMLGFSLVGLACLAAGGHLGAKLVYEYELGRAEVEEVS